MARVAVSNVFKPRLTLDDGTTIEALHASSEPNTELWFFAEGERSMLVWSDGDGGLRTDD